MDIQTSREQVAGILHREDFKFSMASDGSNYRLLFGSAAVFLDFYSWADGDSVLIKVSSPVVLEIDPESAGAAEAYNILNDLNHHHMLVKFRIADNTLIAEYDMLGDALQAIELRNAILTVASAADELDDDLADRLGGKRYDTKLEEWTTELEDDE